MKRPRSYSTKDHIRFKLTGGLRQKSQTLQAPIFNGSPLGYELLSIWIFPRNPTHAESDEITEYSH